MSANNQVTSNPSPSTSDSSLKDIQNKKPRVSRFKHQADLPSATASPSGDVSLPPVEQNEKVLGNNQALASNQHDESLREVEAASNIPMSEMTSKPVSHTQTSQQQLELATRKLSLRKPVPIVMESQGLLKSIETSKSHPQVPLNQVGLNKVQETSEVIQDQSWTYSRPTYRSPIHQAPSPSDKGSTHETSPTSRDVSNDSRPTYRPYRSNSPPSSKGSIPEAHRAGLFPQLQNISRQSIPDGAYIPFFSQDPKTALRDSEAPQVVIDEMPEARTTTGHADYEKEVYIASDMVNPVNTTSIPLNSTVNQTHIPINGQMIQYPYHTGSPVQNHTIQPYDGLHVVDHTTIMPRPVSPSMQPPSHVVTTTVIHEDGRREVFREIDLRRNSMVSLHNQVQNNQHVKHSPTANSSPIFVENGMPLNMTRTNSNQKHQPESLYPQRNRVSSNPPQPSLYAPTPYMAQPVSEAVKTSLYLDRQQQKQSQQSQQEERKGYGYGYYETEVKQQNPTAYSGYHHHHHHQHQQHQHQQPARITSNTPSINLHTPPTNVEEKIAAPVSDLEPVPDIPNPGSIVTSSQIPIRKPSRRPVNQPVLPPKIAELNSEIKPGVTLDEAANRRARLLQAVREVNDF